MVGHAQPPVPGFGQRPVYHPAPGATHLTPLSHDISRLPDSGFAYPEDTGVFSLAGYISEDAGYDGSHATPSDFTGSFCDLTDFESPLRPDSSHSTASSLPHGYATELAPLAFNFDFNPPNPAMSVVYEPRNFIHDGNYPSIGDPHDIADLHGVHDVHKHEVDDIHGVLKHDVEDPEAPEGLEATETAQIHNTIESDAVHAVHELQEATAHEVGNVSELAVVSHELHQVHNDHEVHEVPDIDVQVVTELQSDDASRFDDDVVNELVAAVRDYNEPAPLMEEPEQRIHIVEAAPEPVQLLHKEHPPVAAHPRVKGVAKPERHATKNLTGKFVCTNRTCTEDVREFSRKCEWNKHMDKHDRPYKCHAEGCEKLPGFTYSGGLLRHEREVHAKWGGPKHPLNCPHPTCKRHAGKGFTRQENLNEHLRRCHRVSPSNLGGGETDDTASETAVLSGTKRKRDDEDDDVAELRAEVKKHRQENDELRQKMDAQTLQIDAQTRQIAAMIQQINELQQASIQ